MRLRCRTCRWQCIINPGRSGVCRVRRNRGGELELQTYGVISSVAADPIEKKPLFHFFPGSQVFSLGSWGCNFRCRHCQNWEIACIEGVPDSPRMTPKDAVQAALQQKCAGLAWTYNEPAIGFEYTLDSARLARESRLYTAYVTNGFLSLEALDLLGPWLDALRVDIKGFNDNFYRYIARIANWRGILETTRQARLKWNMHVEVVTNIIPTLNDDDSQLRGIAHWICDELGPLTPWHVTRFFPHFKLIDLPATPLPTMERAVMVGRDAGLRFVYMGNVTGREENTVCYSCGALIIRRVGYVISVNGLSGSMCKSCGADLNIRRTNGPTQGRAPGEERE
jgi:pyruvate formate lyase activating enzyme